MSPPPSRQRFVQTLEEIAKSHGYNFSTLSQNWILQISDPSTGKKCSVFGYTFDVNPAAAVEICKEKSATALVLGAAGVPHIPHHVFLSPSNEHTFEYVPKSGMWAAVQRTVQDLGFPIVFKPLKGTGGLDVIKAHCWKEAEAAVQHIFNREYGLAVSPFKQIRDEYRCFLLDGKVELKYRKVRSHVVGNGTSSVGGLIATRLADGGLDGKAMQALSKAAASMTPEQLESIPLVGAEVPLQWKHNLGQGASACFDVARAMAQKLDELAPRAAAAIGVRFCSVDIVDVEDEGLMVMEVNSGVMMDSLMGQLGDDGPPLARRLYEAAILRAMQSA